MSAAIMNPAMQAPHRKPVPSFATSPSLQPGGPLPRAPQRPFAGQAHEQNYTRTASAMPGVAGGGGGGGGGGPVPTMTAYGRPARRTLSNATSSTSSTSTTAAGLQRAPTNSSYHHAAPRRSTSSRSTGSASPTSYVALMRKQKATVWCDRAQHEDPRILAAQRAARSRAAMEVAGGHNARLPPAARASSGPTGVVGGVRSKIRHHGAPKASTYTGGAATLGVGGVPMRLSASEVDDDADSDEEPGAAPKYHSRTGSGRSSVGSGHRSHSYLVSPRGPSSGSTPPSGHHSPRDTMTGVKEETAASDLPPGGGGAGDGSDDYFSQPGGHGGSGGSSEERFGDVGHLPHAARLPSASTAEQDRRKTSEELRRRGSVDDRAMTMSTGRLFVANPDLSD